MEDHRSLPQARDGSVGLRDLAVITLQLVLLLVVMRQYQIENAGFLWLAQIAFAGFVVHALLPLRYRLPFFALLSLAGTGLVMGLVNLAWMLAIGLVLIAICHIPVSFAMRGALLLLAAAVLAAQRGGIISSPWSEAIWPILGSMFMFRLIVYFHDLRHEKTRAAPARSVAYFYMLPSASFPLFPVVDYSAFRRNYYNDDASRIYQTGATWMLRGVIHLLLYRLVYYHLILAPSEVTSPAAFLQYLIATFLLYFKVSGLFHLIVGMLYLFGFHLPETHNRYFLAAGFTDFWRRINIYWKDFMQKVFYYPAVFRLKRLGPQTAIVVATLWVFLMTWFLHAYQWFWIRGTVHFVLQDILFWTILGVVVVINSLYELRYGRKRTLGKRKFSWRSVGILTLKSYLTFWFIGVLWSFWSCADVVEWLSLWRALSGEYILAVLTWPFISLVVIFLGNIPVTKAASAEGAKARTFGWIRESGVGVATMALLVAISLQPVFIKLGPEVATAIHALRLGQLNRLDTAKMERGYYENLTDVNRFNSQLWEVYAKKPRNWLDVENAALKRFVDNFAGVELIPSYVLSTRHGTVTINRWGMRDRDYAESRDPDTFRAAVLGTSTLMGWGVADGESFEALLEERLNRELVGTTFSKYELLNLGVPGHHPPQQMVSFERSLRFNPNAVMYTAHARELSQAVEYLASVVAKSRAVPYPRLREILSEAGITQGMPQLEMVRVLTPHGRSILKAVYEEITERARQNGMPAIWIFLPNLREGAREEEIPDALRIAENAGFVVINLEHVFKGENIAGIQLAEWDQHPNAYAHRLIADALFRALTEKHERVFLPARAARPGTDQTTIGSETKQ